MGVGEWDLKTLGYLFSMTNGWEDRNRSTRPIPRMTEQERANCLLAAAVDQLVDSKRELQMLRWKVESREDSERDFVADGMLHQLHLSIGDIPIMQGDLSQLSLRARKALIASKVTFVSQITRDRFENIKKCGDATVNELMKWAVFQKKSAYNRKSTGE